MSVSFDLFITMSNSMNKLGLGVELKNLTLYKILNGSTTHNNFKYQIGLNIDILPFDPTGSCKSGGLYFADEFHIMEFISFGMFIATIKINNNEPVYFENNKYKVHQFTITKIRQ